MSLSWDCLIFESSDETTSETPENISYDLSQGQLSVHRDRGTPSKGQRVHTERERERERERESFIRNNLHNGVVSGAAR